MLQMFGVEEDDPRPSAYLARQYLPAPTQPSFDVCQGGGAEEQQPAAVKGQRFHSNILEVS